MPRIRQRLLAEVLLHGDREWYRSDLAKRLEVSPSSLQRELSNLTASGILTHRGEGNRVYFRVNQSCPFLPELRGLLAKTSGLVDVLRDALSPLEPKIRVAFVFGSIARAEERSESDIDLMIIGEVSRADLVSPLRRAEKQLGRPINPKTYTVSEFDGKFAAGHHFIREVAAAKKLFVIGTSHELAEVRKRRPSSTTRRREG